MMGSFTLVLRMYHRIAWFRMRSDTDLSSSVSTSRQTYESLTAQILVLAQGLHTVWVFGDTGIAAGVNQFHNGGMMLSTSTNFPKGVPDHRFL